MIIGVCGVVVAGCHRPLPSDYGSRRPTGSVNGTEILGQLFTVAGHKVTSWPWLSPRLKSNANCIVWFAKGYDAPSKPVKRWLEDWLRAIPGRTLVYIYRDYDAAVDYWAQVRKGTTGDEYKALSEQLADAQNERQLREAGIGNTVDAGWFKVDRGLPRHRLKKFDGAQRWLSDIDPSVLEIETKARMIPSGRAATLLRGDDEILVSRLPVRGSQILLLNSGAFVLNLPLVNRQHRRLAAHLVNEIGPQPQHVVFLDPPGPDPSIYKDEPSTEMSLFRFFGLEPINLVLLHLALLGIVFLFRRSPIFGLPRAVPGARLADFGKHVAAMGHLLERTGDSNFATERIEQYERLVH